MSELRLFGIAAGVVMGIFVPAFVLYSCAGAGYPVVLAAGIDSALGGIGLAGVLIGVTIGAEVDHREEAFPRALRRAPVLVHP